MEEAEENIQSGIYEKFINFIKLFGEDINTREGWAQATRFAKWTDDNWDEAERIKQIELDVYTGYYNFRFRFWIGYTTY